MERITGDEDLVRVVVLLTPRQARELDKAARAAALSRSSFVRMQFNNMLMPTPPNQEEVLAA